MTLRYKILGIPGNLGEAIKQTKEKGLTSAHFRLEAEEDFIKGFIPWEKSMSYFLDCYLSLNRCIAELSHVKLGHYKFHRTYKSRSKEEEKLREERKRFIISLAEKVLEGGNKMSAEGITDIAVNWLSLKEYQTLLEKGDAQSLVKPTSYAYLKAFYNSFPF